MTAILDALRRGVDHLPGGRPVVALRLGKSDDVTRKEISGTSPSHKLGAVDALAMAVMCVEAGSPNAYDYAIAVATECGGRFELASSNCDGGGTPVQRVTSLVRETSDVTTTVIDAMADGVITDNELALIEREIAEAEGVLQKLRQSARAVNFRGKPDAVRAQSAEQWRHAQVGAAA
ncbi:phage regulatory CII family protein [Variovorax sp. UMC13]|uniref:phage regulatory CII family protein n=1 Tax=Variovorax sp. UMC13 TaxID=1862326 RepID=UPI0016042A73|nr:phage regulatory CII family protein [Variovorax sp. UMC13]MBB1599949.1 transcriptional regulator [Variovorax sp. UMC13]